MKPYYEDVSVQLYLGDMREVLPALGVTADACVTDPPYGVTVAAWDRWVHGWPAVVGACLPGSASLWSFGSARMFLDHVDDFAGWSFAQEMLWVKRNGSGPGSRDRLNRVHEWAYHWYRGSWGALHHEWMREPAFVDKGVVRRESGGAAHQGTRPRTTWVDDGTRQPRSVSWVVEAPSVRYQRRHQDEKPLSCVIPLVRECVPPGGLVLDPFVGVGTTLLAASQLGRRAIGIEANEEYCERAAERLSTPDLFAASLGPTDPGGEP